MPETAEPSKFFLSIRKHLARQRARIWSRYVRSRYRFFSWAGRRTWRIFIGITASLILISAWFTPNLHAITGSVWESSARINDLKVLLLTLGGAFATATAIVFSLVVFSIQVNVERLPHRLFQQFGFDTGLICAFILTFVLAIAVAGLSLMVDFLGPIYALMIAVWSLIIIGIIFIFSYRRTLDLINPLKQIMAVIKSAENDMRHWDRHAKILTSALSHDTENSVGNHDVSRLTFFNSNPHWTRATFKCVEHAVSISNHTAKIKDHEVSRGALDAVVQIHQHYVQTKGKTFFANSPLIDNSLATDGFINETLELLRQTLREAIVRADEKHVEQCFEVFTALAAVYIGIDYSNEHASKNHAHLAAGYLANGVETASALKSPDVLMDGVRRMGSLTLGFAACGQPAGSTTLVNRIARIGCITATGDQYWAVTQIAMEQLSRLTLALLMSDLSKCDKYEIRFAHKEICASIWLITKFVMATPEQPLASRHSSCLGPYFSVTSHESFIWYLQKLANQIIDGKVDDEKVQSITANVSDWMEEIRDMTKELIEISIEKKSHFCFDILHAVQKIAEVSMALSNIENCQEHVRDSLKENAKILVYVLSCVPRDRESVGFIETWGFTEFLFQITADAHRRECYEISAAARQRLVSWGFRAGQHDVGFAILERSICALIALSISTTGNGNMARNEVGINLVKHNLPQDLRARTADGLKRRTSVHQSGFRHSAIERAMQNVNENELHQTLTQIAEMLEDPNPATPAA